MISPQLDIATSITNSYEYTMDNNILFRFSHNFGVWTTSLEKKIFQSCK